jgi:hypothetical protein
MPFNTEHFVTLAGNREPWASEHLTLKDRDQSLIALQEDQARRGYIPAVLVETINGWSVRYASGLQGFGIIYFGKGQSRAQVIAAGVAWANQDPEHREFYARKTDLD